MILDIFLSSIPALLLGTSVGLVGGLLPGFGNLLSMILLLPFIAHWTPINIFICYAVLTQISQFVGSLTSLYTGIPGEASSMPVVIESKRLCADQLPTAVAGTALGSAFAGFIATAICVVFVPYLPGISWFYRTEFLVLLMLATAMLVVTLGVQRKLIATALLATGMLMGLVGWNNTVSSGILTFGITELYQGIPLELVMIFLFAAPQLLQTPVRTVPTTTNIKGARPHVPLMSTIGHGIIGFVGGLAPGLTTVLSSQLSYAVSCRQTKDPYYRILASETANNAGAISQLIPLLAIGLPLVASEALTLSMMESRGFLATPESAAGMLIAVAPIFVLVSMIGLVLSWPLANWALTVLRANSQVIRQIILAFLLLSVYVQAYNNHVLVFYLAVSAALIPIGWTLRKLDTTALIFGFFISDRILDHGSRLISLYVI